MVAKTFWGGGRGWFLGAGHRRREMRRSRTPEWVAIFFTRQRRNCHTALFKARLPPFLARSLVVTALSLLSLAIFVRLDFLVRPWILLLLHFAAVLVVVVTTLESKWVRTKKLTMSGGKGFKRESWKENRRRLRSAVAACWREILTCGWASACSACSCRLHYWVRSRSDDRYTLGIVWRRRPRRRRKVYVKGLSFLVLWRSGNWGRARGKIRQWTVEKPRVETLCILSAFFLWLRILEGFCACFYCCFSGACLPVLE